MNIVAITSCAAGIAHTYMAKEAIEQGCKEKGWEVKVETQGAMGAENELTQQEIDKADYVLIAADVTINKLRFVSKKMLVVDTNEAILNPVKLLDSLESRATIFSGKGEKIAGTEIGTSSNKFVRHLMSGISDMVPIAIAAGLLLAVANVFAFKPDPVNPDLVIWAFYDTPLDQFMEAMFNLGKVGFTLMIPILAAGIARSIADKPAVPAAFMGAYIINDPTFLGTEAGAGFLGAILVGFMAGYIVLFMKKIKWPKVIIPVVALLIIPLVSTFLVFCMIYFFIGQPLALFMTALYDFINYITIEYAYAPLIYGCILGAMMGFDLGGPVNKTAMLVSSAIFVDTMTMYGPEGVNAIPQAATGAAIAVAPIGAGLATLIARKRFTIEERTLGSSALIMGMVGVTEGAIPFAARRPQLIIANTISSGIAGGLVAMLGLQFYGGIGSPLGCIVGYVTGGPAG